MKKLNLILMIAATGLTLQACNSTPKDSTAAADSVNMVKDTTTTGETGIAVDTEDAKFAVDAANGGMTEIALSKVAALKATSSTVKEFADMMVMDHTKAGAALAAVAKAKNISLPDSLSADSKKAVADLSAKSGAAFDKAYVDKMMADHKATVNMFADGSKKIKDADLKDFVDKTLPTIKGHLESINRIKSGMK